MCTSSYTHVILTKKGQNPPACSVEISQRFVYAELKY